MSLLSIMPNIPGSTLSNDLRSSGLSFVKPNNLTENKHFPRPTTNNEGSKAVFSTVYYSSESATLNYTNNDGDSVTLSMENIEYQRAMISMGGNVDSDEWKEIVNNVKNEFLKFKESIIKRFIASINGDSTTVDEQSETKETGEIEGLPEYWNAENTSQRIVDFAVSFYDIAESEGKEYYEMMKNAIKEGYSQAMGVLGELPDEVFALSQNTIELALQKLDAWAIEMGISIEEEDVVAVA